MSCTEQPVRTALIRTKEPRMAGTDTPPLRVVGGAK